MEQRDYGLDMIEAVTGRQFTNFAADIEPVFQTGSVNETSLLCSLSLKRSSIYALAGRFLHGVQVAMPASILLR